MRYVVTHSFQDKLTKKYYGVGSIYETQDESRAFELENGGYITPETTEAARVAKASAQNMQSNAQTQSDVQREIEPKTVVNGKVVPLKQSQEATAAFEAQNTQTGIQDHHNNSSEAVQSGQVAQQQTNATQVQEASIRQANVQAGGENMQQHMNQAQEQGNNSPTASQFGYEQQAAAQSSAAAQAQAGEQSQQIAEGAEAAQMQARQASAKSKAAAKKQD